MLGPLALGAVPCLLHHLCYRWGSQVRGGLDKELAGLLPAWTQNPHPPARTLDFPPARSSVLVRAALTSWLHPCFLPFDLQPEDVQEVCRHLWVRPAARPSVHHQASGCSSKWERWVLGRGPQLPFRKPGTGSDVCQPHSWPLSFTLVIFEMMFPWDKSFS